MLQFKLDKTKNIDFTITNENIETRDLSLFRVAKIDLINSLCSESGVSLSQDINFKNISLTGYDNFLLDYTYEPIINKEIVYKINKGSKLCLNLIENSNSKFYYGIEDKNDYKLLKGGFYQGIFEIPNTNEKYLNFNTEKGWTVNMVLHLGDAFNENDGNVRINDFYGNEGFFFYLGTRAENKYKNLTEFESEFILNNFDIEINDVTNEYSNGLFILEDKEYFGYYHSIKGIPYSGRQPNEDGSKKLYYNEKYKDIVNNAFGLRIKNDGKIGYRTIYKTDPCSTSTTQEVSNISLDSFVGYETDNENIEVNKIITKHFTIEEAYTKVPVLSNYTGFFLITLTFERQQPYEDECSLDYIQIKEGTLRIMLNGNTIFINKNFKQPFFHVLDENLEFQEGVPFNFSFGGGTQNLIEAIFLDENKNLESVLDKFFAGTFYGGVRTIEFYNEPLGVDDVRKLIDNDFKNFNIKTLKGGRYINLKTN
jgi:hypothetical protein